jgi:pimeloyl-ACP methyl ester carboxylesterase
VRNILGLLSVIASVVLLDTACQHTAVPAWKTMREPRPMPNPDERGFAAVNGIKIYYQIFNARSSDTVLLLHGGCGNGDNWGSQVPALSETRRVVVLDSRGHGRSTRDDRPLSYRLMADDVAATMDHLKIAQAAIVGWSDGGHVAVDFAINHPARLSALYVLGVSFSRAGQRPIDEKNPLMGGIVAWAAREYARLSATPDRFEDFFKAVTLMWATTPDHSPAELHRIAVRTCVALGEFDEFIFPAHAEEMARLIPQAKFDYLREAGHFLPVQDPARFNRSLLAFLDGH